MSKLASFLCLSCALFSAFSSLQAAQPQPILNGSSNVEGAFATFYIRVYDADGPADLANLNLLINSTFDGASGCWLYYDIPNRQLTSYGDGGWGTASSRCSADNAQIITSSGVTEFAVDIHFSSGWDGDKKIWARASDISAHDSGYTQIGAYTVASSAGPDFSATVLTQTYTVVAGDSVSPAIQVKALQGYQGTIHVTTELSGPGASSVHVAGASSITLPIDTIYPPISSLVLPYSLSTSASTPPGTVNAKVTLSDGTITHTLSLTLLVQSSGMPSVSLVLPSESSRAFSVTATDRNGFQALSSVNFLMNSTFDGSKACWLAWLPVANASDGSGNLALASDDASSWSQIAVGPLPNLAPLGNSQCSFPAGSVKSTGSGENLTLQFTPQFSALFPGSKKIYLNATDRDGSTTGYVSGGSWNVSADPSAQPNFQLAVTPASQNIAAGSNAFFSATVSPFAGFSDTVNFSVTGLPAGATVTALAPVTGHGIAVRRNDFNYNSRWHVSHHDHWRQRRADALHAVAARRLQGPSLRVDQSCRRSCDAAVPIRVDVSLHRSRGLSECGEPQHTVQ